MGIETYNGALNHFMVYIKTSDRESPTEEVQQKDDLSVFSEGAHSIRRKSSYRGCAKGMKD